ncbi:MAG: transcriptional repressor [Bacteroidales bacterium]|nr:transcriptional repressor [Bacteroidales bacterium]
MVNRSVVKILAKHGMKITPQRIAILDVIINLQNHPTADTICDYLRLSYPHISIGTVYKTLDTFESKGIINKVYSETDTMRYDGVITQHHHLYCIDSERIDDYYDDGLNKLLNDYLKKKKIPDFIVEDFKLQIIGRFNEKNKTK